MTPLRSRRPTGGGPLHRYLLPCLIGLVTVIFLGADIVSAQKYSSSPPRYNYDNLPKTGFSCKGKLPGRYYPDPETDCQMFHVCVKMTHREIQDFKFLCPNGTVFDSEHQVCIDYYQVVCHRSDQRTNPLGQIFEIFKLGSDQARDLDAGKFSFVSPDSIERNTLGDDFQVEENNNNRLASSQNALSFRASPPAPSPSRTPKSQKAKEDIFFSNKGFVPSSNFGSYQSSTTRRPTTRRTTTTTTTTTTEAPSSSTPRRPSLETFESYETESFSGFIPSRNSFDRRFEQPSSPPDFDASTEDLSPKDDFEQYRTRTTTTKATTTQRPYIFQNTFRTTLSNVPSTARPAVQQTFQQQASRFNDDYFTKIPDTTRRPVSKAAQFFLHSTIADDYFTPEYTKTTENPFGFNRRHKQPSKISSTTLRPSLIFQSNSGTVRPTFGVTGTTVDYQYETSTLPSTTTRATTTTTEIPTTTEYFGRYRPDEELETRQSTTYNNGFSRSTNFFDTFDNQKRRKDDVGSKPRDFPPQLSPDFVEEESLRPRNIHGASVPQNSLEPKAVSHQPRDNFGFSTIPPPTTAEPFSTPPPTTASALEQETAQTLAARLQNQLFKKTTTAKNPEKYSIFFGRSTPSVSDDRLPATRPTKSSYYDSTSSTPRTRHRVRSTTVSPDFEEPSRGVTFDRRRIISRIGTVSSTVAPEGNGTRPLRRGARRRVRIGAGDIQRQTGKDFDPELKYKRRRFESARVNKEGLGPKNDEIFNAEASVFRGDPTLNFFQEQRKDENSGSQKIEQSQKDSQQKEQAQPVNHYERNYGRRVRPNGGDEHQNINDNEGSNNSRGNGPANRVHKGEGPPQPLPPGNGPQLRRRVVKRIRPKTTTPEPGSIQEGGNSTPKKPFLVTGSTLRPVTRINVKTKLGGKISTTYRTTEITDGTSSSTTSTTTTTTTEEPELVTASDDEVAKIREKASSSPRPGLRKKFPPQPRNNGSRLVIKLVNDQPPLFLPSSSFPSSPISIKKPILTSFSNNKPSSSSSQNQPSGPKSGSKKSSNANSDNEEESNTRSPDYDYAYYNSDDATDYDSETSKLDHQNFGKKPRRQQHNNDSS